jgi:hypothetical protein
MDGRSEQELAARYSLEGTASAVPKIQRASGVLTPEVNGRKIRSSDALEKDLAPA